MTDFSRRSEAERYFKSVLPQLTETNVKAVFSFYPAFSDDEQGRYTHFADGDVYILLESNTCLVIKYLYVDELDVQLRALTDEEREGYSQLRETDFFNWTRNLYTFRMAEVIGTETGSLEYGSITDVSLKPVTGKYNKWRGQRVDVVAPVAETFDEIKFTMSNGKSFTVCAADAEVDGYAMVWSEDAVETYAERDADGT